MKNVGIGLIGSGLWGAMHARTYATIDYAKLVGVADVDLSRAKALADQFRADAYEDYRILLADDRIDAVAIVTPDPTHESIALHAAAAGKHILVEKPMAMTVEGCERILKAAEKA